MRQAVIGPYIVDFLCRERAFVIEVDGATHGSTAEVTYDLKRTQYLESRGFMVHRINNEDVFRKLDESLIGIVAMLDQRPGTFRRNRPLSPSDSSPSKLGERKTS